MGVTYILLKINNENNLEIVAENSLACEHESIFNSGLHGPVPWRVSGHGSRRDQDLRWRPKGNQTSDQTLAVVLTWDVSHTSIQTSYDNGDLLLTSHRLLWSHPSNRHEVLSLPLSLVVYAEEEPGGRLFGSDKIVLHLGQPQQSSNIRTRNKQKAFKQT